MKTDIVDPKQDFYERLVHELPIHEGTKILEMGSGQSRAISPVLRKFPRLHYVGIEPDTAEAQRASRLLEEYENVKILNRLAYDAVEGCGESDLCVSLSVLEHVKQLERFLANSIRHIKRGGLLVHRYDLGHSLYPSSLKERFHVFFWGNTFLAFLPESKFVRYVAEEEVKGVLEKCGAKIEKVTYHQMPNHKLFLKTFRGETEKKKELAKELLDWEYRISKFLIEMPLKTREYLFPSITIWARRV